MKSIRFATIGSNFIVDSFLKGAAHDERFKHVAVYSRTFERGIEFVTKHYGSASYVAVQDGLYSDLLAAKNGGSSQVDNPSLVTTSIQQSIPAASSMVTPLKIYTSLEDLARDPEVDAVYIASPNICHAEQAILMMEHGKHVICEKPMASTFAEAQSMVAAARKYGVVLMEAMKTTLLPNYAAVRDALHRIGKVRRFFAQFCQYSSRYDSFREGLVLNTFNPAMKGGALLDLGVYGIAPLVHLFGMPLCVQSSETIVYPGKSATIQTGGTIVHNMSDYSSQQNAAMGNCIASEVDASACGEGIAARNVDASACGEGIAARNVDASACGEGIVARNVDASACGEGIAARNVDASACGEGIVARNVDATQGIDGQGTMLLTYPEMEGVIMYSKISDSTLPTEIQGEEGRILISKLSQMIDPRIVFRDGRTEDISVPTIEDNMYYEVREFIDLVFSGKIESNENTFERTLQVMQLVTMAQNNNSSNKFS